VYVECLADDAYVEGAEDACGASEAGSLGGDEGGLGVAVDALHEGAALVAEGGRVGACLDALGYVLEARAAAEVGADAV